VKVTNTELQDINQLMGYRDAHWYIKDNWIGFSDCQTGCSASHFYGFSEDDGLTEMVKLLPVANERLRKRNF